MEQYIPNMQSPCSHINHVRRPARIKNREWDDSGSALKVLEEHEVH